jgi:hypothetical protein
MGGHFDAVGFGDPGRGFEATREHLRSAVAGGRRVGEAGEVVYYELETPGGCGLVAATDRAGFLLNGCPYFRGRYVQRIVIDGLEAWDAAEASQGGAHGRLAGADSAVVFALPQFAIERAVGRSGRQPINLVGLGYRATTQASERPGSLGSPRREYWRPTDPAADLPPSRHCNVECRGKVERAALLSNDRTGARLAYALLDCGQARIEVIVDLPSLIGGLAEGIHLEGSFWLVGRYVPERS